MSYSDFKSFIQANYKDILMGEISNFVNEKYDAHGFHSINVLSLCEQKIDNFEIKNMVCHDDIGPHITMDIHCAADIVTMGLGKKQYEAGRRTRWFTVYVRAILREGLHDFLPLRVEEYGPGKFELEGALDEFLIPYISTEMLEEKAQDFIDLYIGKKEEYDSVFFPYKEIIEQMGIEMYRADLPENCFGRMYFREDNAEVYCKKNGSGENGPINTEVNPGTMLISTTVHFMHEFGTGLHTIAHELIHWELHQKFFEILALLSEDNKMLSCEVEPEIDIQNMNGIQKAIWWAEWQANSLATRILMPKDLFVSLLRQKYTYEVENRLRAYRTFPAILESTLEDMAVLFRVSNFAVKNRARQLGFDIAEGSFVYVDRERYPAFSFKPDTLGRNQTFIIDEENYKRLYESDEEFARLIDAGLFVYTGYVVCINDEKYLERNSEYKSGLILSDYGSNLAEKCCLVFEKQYTQSNWEETVFYNECYLCRNVSSDRYMEAHYNTNFENNQKVAEIAKQIKLRREEKKKLDKIKTQIYQMSFAATFDYHRKRRKISYTQLADRTYLSETTLKSYANGSKSPVLENLMAIFIGMNLHPDFCYDLLDKAGKKLTNVDKDEIYKMLIDEHTDGNLEQWNMILEAAGYEPIPKK